MTQASQSVYKWCDSLLATPIAEEQTEDNHLLQTLDEGIKSMNLARTELRNSSLIFNTATGKLESLQFRFENELQVKSKHLQSKASQEIIENFKVRLQSTEKFYKNLKARASKRFRDIGVLMTQIDKIKIDVATDENPKQSSENLIAKCTEFQEK